MAGHDIVVIGASAGGVEVLSQMVRGLPAGLPASLFVVCHFPLGGRSVLPEILSRQGALLASHARDGEPFYPGHIYVAPPDYHLLLQDGVTRLSRGARENRHRPAIDPLFRSAARAYGPRVVGVILSGALHDGVAGLMAVRAAGGVAVVQDPRDAPMGYLPLTASEIAGADHMVSSARLAAKLVELVHSPVPTEEGAALNDPIDESAEKVARDMNQQVHGSRNGQIAIFTCPECGGCLWETDEGAGVRFRCHVGHAYQAELLLEEQTANLEAALWTAVRTFREKRLLSRQLAGVARQQGKEETAERFEEEARVAEEYGNQIHQYLARHPPGGAVGSG